MVKKLTTALSTILILAIISPAAAQKRSQATRTASTKPSIKFIDAIEVSAVDGGVPNKIKAASSESISKVHAPVSSPEVISADNTSAVELATAMQLKYAVLLNTEVEQIQNAELFAAVDEWYGTPYALGGSTKAGIDCSAFVQAVYAKLFEISMPRTAKEQYKATHSILRNNLQPGDLIFFSTHGSGVTHVGIYLQSNKFVHAATSGGVMISDLFEEYWVKHFVAIGHYERETELQTLAVKP